MPDEVGEGWARRLSEFNKLVPIPIIILAVFGALAIADLLLDFAWNTFLSYEFGLRPLDFVSGLGLLVLILIVVGILVGLKSGE